MKLKKKNRGNPRPKTEHLKKHQFKPGQSGNPTGRPKKKPIQEEIERLISEDPKFIQEIAKQALQKAREELGWFEQIRAMLDGPLDDSPTGSAADPVNFNINVRFREPDKKD